MKYHIWVFIVFIGATKGRLQSEESAFKKLTYSVSPSNYQVEDIKNAAQFGFAQERGPAWYTDTSQGKSDFDISTSGDSVTSEFTSGSSGPDETSSTRSSEETHESKQRTSYPRHCTTCLNDMMKSYKNINIRWVCGGYQRARRSFKSTCMMRYRNCQDGTMFIKVYDGKCKNDSYHGRHFFYDYKT